MSYKTGNFSVTVGGMEVGQLHITTSGLMMVFDCVCTSRRQEVFRLAAVCGREYIPLGVMIPDHVVLRLKKSFSKNALEASGYRDTETFHLIRTGETYAPEDFGTSYTADHCNNIGGEQSEAEPAPTFEKEWSILQAPACNQETATDTPFPLQPATVPETSKYVPENTLELSEPKQILSVAESEPLTINAQSDNSTQQQEPIIVSSWMPIQSPSSLFTDQTIAQACEQTTDTLMLEQDGYALLAVPVSQSNPFPMMSVFCLGHSEEIDGQAYIVFKIKNGSLTL